MAQADHGELTTVGRAMFFFAGSVLLVGGVPARAAAPAQFQVWGTAGPKLPPAPKGWRRVAGDRGASPPLAPTPDERARGFVLAAREAMMPAPPGAAPFALERAAELKASAARGE